MKPGPESDAVYISHMLECIDRVQEYAQGDSARFRTTRMVQDAVIRNLQLMAESSQRISDGCKATAPEIPWRAIVGFRNVLVHEYLAIDIEAVWQVVEHELPPLKLALLRMQRELP